MAIKKNEKNYDDIGNNMYSGDFGVPDQEPVFRVS